MRYIFMTFPFLLAAITLSAVIKTKAPQIQGIYIGMAAMTAFAWMTYARLIRGDILALKERDYVLAAKSIGATNLRVLLRHILPNSLYSTLVVASMDIGTYVLTFSALSFLGLGAEVGCLYSQRGPYNRRYVNNRPSSVSRRVCAFQRGNVAHSYIKCATGLRVKGLCA